MSITILEGDITRAKVDVIVNAANTKMLESWQKVEQDLQYTGEED